MNLLYIANTDIGKKGAKYIAILMKCNKSISTLNLSNSKYISNIIII